MLVGSGSNQMFNRGVEWAVAPQTLYSDQQVHVVLVMTPVGGNGSSADNFTIQLTLRKLGNVVLVSGLLTSAPGGSSQAVPTFMLFTSTTVLPASYTPAFPRNMVCSGNYRIGSSSYLDEYQFIIDQTGRVFITNLPSFTAMPFKASMSCISTYYPLVSGDI